MILLGVVYNGKSTSYYRKQPPVLNSVLSVVNNNPSLPNLKDPHFTFFSKKSALFMQRKREKSLWLKERTFVYWHHTYLIQI